MLGEKALHSALKFYYEPDASFHEKEAFGFVADIRNEDGVTEIQTKNLFAMRRKLEVYLKQVPVTLVHPVIRERRLIYLDPETGELSRPRLSPKKGRVEDAFSELVHILGVLGDPGLVIVIPLVDAEEYRIRAAGKKRRRGGNADLKYELLPTRLAEETVLAVPSDALRLLTPALIEKAGGAGFTIKETAQELKLDYRTASAMCASLCAMGALRRERQGREYRHFLNCKGE